MSTPSSQARSSQHPDILVDISISPQPHRTKRTHRTATIIPHPAREQLITEAAYHRAEARGFEPGHELEDWLAAEAEVDARLSGEGRAY